MPPIVFTEQQHRAIRTVGRSVLVSAAAGSGKTAVLAERCAYLVCDAPRRQRCDADQLLVLTFTDAAAAEMRSRIMDAIRARADADPGNDRLHEQVTLVGAAQISTIHSFCLWLIRRWFSHVGVDPGAVVMGEEETLLLKQETLSQLFSWLYATSDTSAKPLGDAAEPAAQEASRPVPSAEGTDEALKSAFVQLVNDYGLGDDRAIEQFVLRLYEFTTSLPDPRRWLRDAHESLTDRPEQIVAGVVEELRRELRAQAGHCDAEVRAIKAGDPIGHAYGARIQDYAAQLRAWIDGVGESEAADDAGALLDRFEKTRREIAEYEFEKAPTVRLAKDADPAIRAARDAASARLSGVKKRLFGERLRKRFGLFSIEAWIGGLQRTAPYVWTVVESVLAFREAYSARKRERGVLDFADLERHAFELLSDDATGTLPSDIARSLHGRFAHVLVDEFQDINPLQQAIIRLVSREADPDRADNLFAVGDIKQSIYRFRLAEPSLFAERLNRFRGIDPAGVAIALQENFRSRPEILDGVNHVFRHLMRGEDQPVRYDAEAELHPGRTIDASSRHTPVEMHLLERAWQASAGEDDDDAASVSASDPFEPSRWTPIEREAYLIGQRIQALLGSEELKGADQPIQHRDIAVLLRAKRVHGEQIASMLTAMGIPAHADSGGSLMGRREVREVLAALELFDNFQQDIPLASALRSGILGERLSADELVQVRCLDRDVAFHDVVRRYARGGSDDALRDRLSRFVDRVEHYRRESRRRPLAEVLWELYDQEGWLAYVGGLPGGVGRRANLLKLHDIAREFSTFRKQGLHRFLKFVHQLEEGDRQIAVAPTLGEGDDVVRVMSIHQAKGLEFPIVFVAGLGTKLNLGDRAGRMIYERAVGIGLRVVDKERMIEFPSAAHLRVAADIERTTREEELRILYVAMTRARDKLILVGSRRSAEEALAKAAVVDRAGPSGLTIASAQTPLDWLIPVIATAPRDAHPLFEVDHHGIEEMSSWRRPDQVRDGGDAVLRAAARWEPLPEGEPFAPDDSAVGAVLSRINNVYPYAAATSVRAAVAAGQFKGTYDYLQNPEERADRPRSSDFLIPPSRDDAEPARDAVHRGVITHRVLQHLDWSVAVDSAGVVSELQRMLASDVITPEDRSIIDEDSIEWLVSTPLGEAIRAAGDAFRREFLYTATEPLTLFDARTAAPEGDRVLVRGIVDGILPVSGGIEIVDYKTDSIDRGQVADRARQYRTQLELYARATGRIWRQPVLRCWLAFLGPRELVSWSPEQGAQS